MRPILNDDLLTFYKLLILNIGDSNQEDYSTIRVAPNSKNFQDTLDSPSSSEILSNQDTPSNFKSGDVPSIQDTVKIQDLQETYHACYFNKYYGVRADQLKQERQSFLGKLLENNTVKTLPASPYTLGFLRMS